MKRTIFFVALILISFSAFAQIPVTISSDVDPGTIIDRINQAQRFAQTIENAIQQLQTASESLQYQIQALQQLSTGSWQGFVNAWNDETVALNGYTQILAQMPSLADIQAVSDLIQSQGYKAALSNMQSLMKNWSLASNIVHSTDNLVKNTAYRQQLWNDAMSNSANSQSTVGQLQTLNQALGLLGGEVQDLNLNMGSWKDYFVAQVEQQQMQQRIEDQEASNFMEGNAAANWVYSTGDIQQLEDSHQ